MKVFLYHQVRRIVASPLKSSQQDEISLLSHPELFEEWMLGLVLGLELHVSVVVPARERGK